MRGHDRRLCQGCKGIRAIRNGQNRTGSRLFLVEKRRNEEADSLSVCILWARVISRGYPDFLFCRAYQKTNSARKL